MGLVDDRGLSARRSGGAAELSRFLDESQAALDELVSRAARAITLSTVNGYDRRVRVDTGLLRGSTLVTPNAASPSGRDPGETDKSGARVRREAQAAVASIKPYTVSFIENNREYAGWREQLDSTMALAIEETVGAFDAG